jgi:hypothetical protein
LKTGANSFIWVMRMVCFCLLLAATSARCQNGGILAQAGVKNNGTVTVDSFDSSDPNHSIWQPNAVYRLNYFSPGTKYGTWSNSLSYVSNSFPSRTANVAVFTDSNVVQLIGGLTIAGYLESGPNGTASIGSQASIGDLPWCFGVNGTGPGTGQTGLEPGHWIQNVNRNFTSYPRPAIHNSWQTSWLPVSAPNGNIIKIGGGWWYTNGVWTNIGGVYYTNTGSGFTIGGVTYSQLITNRLQNTNWVYYATGQLTQNLFVDAQYVVLYLTNGWSYTGHQVFTLNTNADIIIYSAGDVTATALSVINNLGNYTHAFSLYDVAGYPIAVSLGGNDMPAGNYYLPSSTLSLGGGGNSGDFAVSIVCYSFNDGGHVNIHFDDSLGGLIPPWIIQQPTNQIVQLGSDATLNVNAGGSELSYQWFFTDTNWQVGTNVFYGATNEIPGATNSSLVLTDLQLTNAGYYEVVVANLGGSVISQFASLSVYADATPVLSGTLNPISGQFQLYITGQTGLDYTLEASTNLVDWVTLSTNAAPFSFAETNMPAYPQRFYRSVYIP